MPSGFFWLLARIYDVLPQTALLQNLAMYDVVIDPRLVPVVAVAFKVVAAGHVVVALASIVASAAARRLAFPGMSQRRDLPPATLALSKPASYTVRPRSPRRRSVQGVVGTTRAALQGAWDGWFGPHGYFGVASPHFDAIFLAREAVEVALQTYQALQLSWFSSRRWLNALYVGLLTLNCLVPVIVHRLCPNQSPRQRLWCLLADVVLDVTTTVLVPATLLVPYVGAYEPRFLDFSFVKWYDTRFLVPLLNESRLLLVTSQFDLASRLFFCLGLVSGVRSIARLLVVDPSGDLAAPKAPTDSAQTVSSRGSQSRTTVDSHTERAHKVAPLVTIVHTKAGVVAGLPTPENSHKRLVDRCHRLFAIWGLVVGAIHVAAEFPRASPSCILSVRPWLRSQAGCALFEYSCWGRHTRGSTAELDDAFRQVDPQTLVALVIRDCPSVHVPAALGRFHELVGMKIVNSTISSWDDDGALTDSDHPKICFLFIVATAFATPSGSGTLPTGLLTPQFPRGLLDVEIVRSNLQQLPSDLHERWPTSMALVFEDCQFDAFPRVLLDMNPIMIAMVGTNFETVPRELFQCESLSYVQISRSPLLDIPEVPRPPPALQAILIKYTNVSSLPTWIRARDGGYLASGGFISAIESPLCLDPEEDQTPDEHVIRQSIDCTPYEGDGVYYPMSVDSLQ